MPPSAPRTPFPQRGTSGTLASSDPLGPALIRVLRLPSHRLRGRPIRQLRGELQRLLQDCHRFFQVADLQRVTESALQYITDVADPLLRPRPWRRRLGHDSLRHQMLWARLEVGPAIVVRHQKEDGGDRSAIDDPLKAELAWIGHQGADVLTASLRQPGDERARKSV